MQLKAPNDSRFLLRLMLLLVFGCLPFTEANQVPSGRSPSLHKKDPDGLAPLPPLAAPAPPYPTGIGEQSVEPNKKPYCEAAHPCQCPPSACEALTLEPEACSKQLKNNLGPIIHQRLTELQEKTRTVESTIDMAGQIIEMLKLLKESDSEFNTVRKDMLNGAQQLRNAFHRLGNEMHHVYS